MTAVAQTERLLTLEEWKNLDWPDDVRYELVEGRLIEVASGSGMHNNLAGGLYSLLKENLSKNTWKALVPGVEVPVPAIKGPTRRIPDLSVVRKAAYDADPDNNEYPAEDTLLVVEVLSPSNRLKDMTSKFENYQRAGVPHYWIFDVRPGTTAPWATILKLVNGSYQEQSARSKDTVTIADPIALSFTLKDLLE